MIPPSSLSIGKKSAPARPGALLLIVILIAGLTAFVMSLSIAGRGIREAGSGFSESRMQMVLSAAYGCVDEGLYRLKLDSSYAGGSMNVNGVTCVITVPDPNQVSVTATLDRWTRTVSAYVSSWETPTKISWWLVN